MRTWVLASLLGSLASVARPDALEAARAPLVSVGLESEATRYGTSFETVYQLDLKPSMTVRWHGMDCPPSCR